MSKSILIQGTAERRAVPTGAAGRMIREIAAQRDLLAEQLAYAVEHLPEHRQMYLRGASETIEYALDRLLALLPKNDAQRDNDKKEESGNGA